MKLSKSCFAGAFKGVAIFKEFYVWGGWSVRNIFNGYSGWFDDNASLLLPLLPKEKAEKLQPCLVAMKNY
ncbi:MAG: alkyl sulfatase dimerization domain-containing protein [Bacteroidota bacterium]